MLAMLGWVFELLHLWLYRNLQVDALQSPVELPNASCRAASSACKAPGEAAPIYCVDVPVFCIRGRGFQLPAECSRG